MRSSFYSVIFHLNGEPDDPARVTDLIGQVLQPAFLRGTVRGSSLISAVMGWRNPLHIEDVRFAATGLDPCIQRVSLHPSAFAVNSGTLLEALLGIGTLSEADIVEDVIASLDELEQPAFMWDWKE